MENLENGVNPQYVATPKNDFKGQFADMFTYYVRNLNSLSKDEREDYRRFDKAANAKQLREWAENIHISANTEDMTSIELAKFINSSDDKALDAFLHEVLQNPRIISEKADALTQQNEEEKIKNGNNTVILYRNGEQNFTAVGDDADKTADTLGILPDELLGEETPVTNINNAGVALLQHNSVKYAIVDPVTDLNIVNGQDNGMTKENKLLMQMGQLAVLSKGDTVSIETNGDLLGNKPYGNEIGIEMYKGTYYMVYAEPENKMMMMSFPIQSFDPSDGKANSYTSMPDDDMAKFQNYFNQNFNNLKEKVINAPFDRKEQDNNFKRLIDQNDRLSKENPDTIVLIKQRGYIEAFSTSAINAANALGLPLHNRTDHKKSTTVPFARMTVDDYRRLLDTENNIYLAKPFAKDKIIEMNLTKVSPEERIAIGNPQKQNENRNIKR